ncbi:MAG: NUDIX hydrolase [Bacillota bacterium]|nr:MAG: NUDIX hydrolase [Bacillota bacterium]
MFEGRVVSLRVDEVILTPGGRRARREVVEHPGAVGVVPVTAEGEVVLVRQYRYSVGEPLLEIPAGTIEPGEDPDDTVSRELAEETGYVAGETRRLASLYSSPGFCNEVIHIYLALVDPRPAELPAPDADEHLEVVMMPLDDAVALARSGGFKDAKSTVGILLAAPLLG